MCYYDEVKRTKKNSKKKNTTPIRMTNKMTISHRTEEKKIWYSSFQIILSRLLVYTYMEEKKGGHDRNSFTNDKQHFYLLEQFICMRKKRQQNRAKRVVAFYSHQPTATKCRKLRATMIKTSNQRQTRTMKLCDKIYYIFHPLCDLLKSASRSDKLNLLMTNNWLTQMLPDIVHYIHNIYIYMHRRLFMEI